MHNFDSSKNVTGFNTPPTGKNCSYLSSEEKGYDIMYNLKE